VIVLPAFAMVEWFFKSLKGECAELESERILAAGMNIAQSGIAVFVFKIRTASGVLVKLADG
jgi:hypothetical protein